MKNNKAPSPDDLANNVMILGGEESVNKTNNKKSEADFRDKINTS